MAGPELVQRAPEVVGRSNWAPSMARVQGQGDLLLSRFDLLHVSESGWFECDR
jgi:hypothetical protein